MSVAFSLNGSTATDGVDFTRSVTGGSLTLPAGIFTTSVTITTSLNDNLVEGDETILATIGPSTYGIINASVAIILQDDDTPTVSMTVADASASEAGPDVGVFTLSRSGPLTSDLVVTLARGGTATAANDYTADPTSIAGTGTITVTIPASKDSVPITITPVNDTTAEVSETITLTIVPQAAYRVGQSHAQISISDDDAPMINIAATAVQAVEGGALGVVTIQRTGDPTTQISVGITTTGSTATAGSDYATLASPVVLEANVTTKDIYISPIDDALPETSETVKVTLVSGTGYSLGAITDATVTIADNDLPTVTIAAIQPNAAEGTTLVTGVVRFTRTGDTTTTLSVPFTLGGTASSTSGTDYTLAPNGSAISFAVGANTADLTITPVNNAVASGDKTVVVTLGNGTFIVGAEASTTVIIGDDEHPTVRIVATDDIATEAGLTPAMLTVSRSAASGTELTIPLVISGGASPGVDYLAMPASITIAANQTSATAVVTPRDDSMVEVRETVVVALDEGAGYALAEDAAFAQVIIISDDLPAPQINYQTASHLIASAVGNVPEGLDIASLEAATTTSGVTLSTSIANGGFLVSAGLAATGTTSAQVSLSYRTASGYLSPPTIATLRWASGAGSIVEAGEPASAPLPPPGITLSFVDSTLTGEKRGTLRGQPVAFSNTNGDALTPIQVNISTQTHGGTVDRAEVISSDGQSIDVPGGTGVANLKFRNDGIYTIRAVVHTVRGEQKAVGEQSLPERLVIDRTKPNMALFTNKELWESPTLPRQLVFPGRLSWWDSYSISDTLPSGSVPIYLNGNAENGATGNAAFRKLRNTLAFNADAFSMDMIPDNELSLLSGKKAITLAPSTGGWSLSYIKDGSTDEVTGIHFGGPPPDGGGFGVAFDIVPEDRAGNKMDFGLPVNLEVRRHFFGYNPPPNLGFRIRPYQSPTFFSFQFFYVANNSDLWIDSISASNRNYVWGGKGIFNNPVSSSSKYDWENPDVIEKSMTYFTRDWAGNIASGRIDWGGLMPGSPWFVDHGVSTRGWIWDVIGPGNAFQREPFDFSVDGDSRFNVFTYYYVKDATQYRYVDHITVQKVTGSPVVPEPKYFTDVWGNPTTERKEFSNGVEASPFSVGAGDQRIFGPAIINSKRSWEDERWVPFMIKDPVVGQMSGAAFDIWNGDGAGGAEYAGPFVYNGNALTGWMKVDGAGAFPIVASFSSRDYKEVSLSLNSPAPWGTAIGLAPDTISSCTETTVTIFSEFLLGNQLDESKFDRLGDYVRLLSVGENVTDVTYEAAKYAADRSLENMRGKIAIVDQKFIYSHKKTSNGQALELKLRVGPDVPAGLYNVDIKLGAVHAFTDEASKPYAGKNGAHRMIEALRVVDLQWNRPLTTQAAATSVTTTTIPLSVPTPGIRLDSIPAVTQGADSRLSVTLSGEVRDPLADSEQGPSNVYGSLSVAINGVNADGISVTVAADGPVGLWKPFPRKGTFSREVTFPAQEGVHTVQLSTAKNAAGYAASTSLLVSVQSRTVPIPGAPGSDEIVGKMALSVDRPDVQHVRMWWGTGDPPTDAVVLTVDPNDATRFTGASGPVTFEMKATWPVANATVKDAFSLDLTTRWTASPMQGKLTWQMSETTVSSERFVGFHDVITPGVPGGDNPGLQTWTASVTGGGGAGVGTWTPLAVRIKGMTAAEFDGLLVDGIKYETIERDGWLYAAKGGRPILYGAIPAGDGGAMLRLAAGSLNTTRLLSGNQELDVKVNDIKYWAHSARFSTRVAIGLQGWEEMDLLAGGSQRFGRFAHVGVATPEVRIDHSALSVMNDGRLHVEGDVFDPLEAVSGTKAMNVLVNDTLAEVEPLSAGEFPTLAGGGRRRFTATVPLPQTKMLIWAVATNAAGGQAYDRLMVDDGEFGPDWKGSRSWGRVSRYRFGSRSSNQILREKDRGWRVYIQPGENQSDRKLVDIELASDQSVVTKPLVVTRVNDNLADLELLNTLGSQAGKVVLTVDDLDADIYVVVEAPAEQRDLWSPDPSLWEPTPKGWRRRIEQAGLEITPADVPVGVMGSGYDTTDLPLIAKVRNLQAGDVAVRISSVNVASVRDQNIGTIAEPSSPAVLPLPRSPVTTLPSRPVSLRLGVNQIGLDIVRDGEGQSVARQEDIGVYVVDPVFPYTPVSGVDARASFEATTNEDKQKVPAPEGLPDPVAIVPRGHVFIVHLAKGREFFENDVQAFFRKNDLTVVGSSRLLDENNVVEVAVWVQVKGKRGFAWSKVLKDGKPHFITRVFGDENSEELFTPAVQRMNAHLKQGPPRRAFTDGGDAWQRELSRLDEEVRLEIYKAQWNTVQGTLGSHTPRLEVLDCRYVESFVEKSVYTANSGEDLNGTRKSFEEAYARLRSPSGDRSGEGAAYRYATYTFAGADRPVKNRTRGSLNDGTGQSVAQPPRVFFHASQAGSLDDLAQRAIAAGGLVLSIHGYNNGQGYDGDEDQPVRINATDGGEKEPYRMLTNYWPVLERTLRKEGVISATTPVIHTWWSNSVNREFMLLDFPLLGDYPDGAFFNLDNPTAHFTGADKVRKFLVDLSIRIGALNPDKKKVPINVIAESLGNRVAVSTFDAIGRDESKARFEEKSETPLRYLALHPAMRQIDITRDFAAEASEETQRVKGETTFTHPYPQSPLLSEMRVLASTEANQCRVFLAYSPFDKAGLAFLAGQRDDPKTEENKPTLPTGMLGRTGLGGTGLLVGRKSYQPAANQANIRAVHVGGEGDPQGPGGVLAQDFWHVDLWGWALADQPYLSRSIYGNNIPDTTLNGDERDYLNRALVVFSSEVIAPGWEINSIVSVPPWNQISIRQGAIDRAWDLPKKLFTVGTITVGP